MSTCHRWLGQPGASPGHQCELEVDPTPEGPQTPVSGITLFSLLQEMHGGAGSRHSQSRVGRAGSPGGWDGHVPQPPALGTAAYLVPLLLGNVQVPLAADHSLIKSAQDLECVAQVPTGLGLPHAVANSPGEREGIRDQAEGWLCLGGSLGLTGNLCPLGDTGQGASGIGRPGLREATNWSPWLRVTSSARLG